MVAVHGCPSVGEAYAHSPASSNHAAGDVHVTVASPGLHSRKSAIWDHPAAVSPAEKDVASELRTLLASPELTSEVLLAYLKVTEPWP